MEPRLIRNFCLIAHINHGKSTLADRLLEKTATIPPRQMREQVLDRMDLERERGITIKAQAVRMKYLAQDGQTYFLNLIDTPGHVDFSYEVSRSLAAAEGTLLVVDAAQGVEAQTVANFELAKKNGLRILPILNKIDLEVANPNQVERELQELGLKEPPLLVSAKTGQEVSQVLEEIVKKIPPPKGYLNAPLKALIFDSFFDPYQGVVLLVRIVEGEVKKDTKIKLMAEDIETEVKEVGVFTPEMEATLRLSAGEVGYLKTGLKKAQDVRVGDTVTLVDQPASTPLPGYKEPKPFVFCGLYPLEGGEYRRLKGSLEKLSLNDSSFNFKPERSTSLGFGFRAGFLGLLHLEIVKERLEREFGLGVIMSYPQVEYKVIGASSNISLVRSAAEFPESIKIKKIEEPYVVMVILTPPDYLGKIFELLLSTGGGQRSSPKITYLSENRVKLELEFPLREALWGFYDRLKSVTKGYGSLDYEFMGYKKAKLVKLEFLLSGQVIDSLSLIVPENKANFEARRLVEKVKEVVPRQLFEVPVQARIKGKIIARETIKALKKDVTAKLYGGDVTRKRKLLEKQKAGKKKMKKLGKLSLPPETFFDLLKVSPK